MSLIKLLAKFCFLVVVINASLNFWNHVLEDLFSQLTLDAGEKTGGKKEDNRYVAHHSSSDWTKLTVWNGQRDLTRKLNELKHFSAGWKKISLYTDMFILLGFDKVKYGFHFYRSFLVGKFIFIIFSLASSSACSLSFYAYLKNHVASKMPCVN